MCRTQGLAGKGGRALPSNRLMGMCRWMGSHFYHWIDYHEGIAFSTELLAHFRDLGEQGGGGGKNNSVIADFKNVTIFITLSGPNVSIHFRRISIEGFIR